MAEVIEGTIEYTKIEALLYAWGRERAQMRRSIRDSLNTPKQSSISAMIEQQRIFEGRLRGVRRSRPRPPSVPMPKGQRRARQCECGTVFVGPFCPSCSPDPAVVAIAEADLDARGRGTQSTKIAPLKYGLSSRAASVNYAINRLSRRLGTAINLHYGEDLPDRVCAKLLDMPRHDFTLRRRAAVAAVAEILAEREESEIQSARLPSG